MIDPMPRPYAMLPPRMPEADEIACLRVERGAALAVIARLRAEIARLRAELDAALAKIGGDA